MTSRNFASLDVRAAFAAFPDAAQPTLFALRNLIFDMAGQDPRIGPVEEALRWGQPAYLTPKTKSGTTIRLGLSKTGVPAIFTHCQTSVISDFRQIHEADFEFDGDRAVYLSSTQPLPEIAMRQLICAALTYHL